MVVIPEQVPSDAVKVYTVFTDGVTIRLGEEVTWLTGCQVKEVATAVAVSVAVRFVQVIVGLVTALTASGATENATVAEAVPHPF
jgi:hypothetical protein